MNEHKRLMWKWSNDPADPCSLDVQWESDPNDPLDEGYPYWPDGSVPPRVYRFVHTDCQASAVAYTALRD